MADNQEFAGQPAHYLHEQGDDSCREIGKTFPFGGTVGDHISAPPLVFARVEALHIIERQAVPCPEIDFPQFVERLDRFASSFRDNAGCFK